MFSSVNPETHKYIGRVFWNNELYSYGKFYLERAKNYFYQDPELHVLLAIVYEAEGRRQKALPAHTQARRHLPGHLQLHSHHTREHGGRRGNRHTP